MSGPCLALLCVDRGRCRPRAAPSPRPGSEQPAMPTREIPQSEWPEFFTSFSQIHEGWLCTVEILDSAIGAQVQATDARFMGLTAERGGDSSIEIALGDEPERHLGHVVHAPEH